ncbi:MAG TPA: putative baseplate assembly protein [Pyrinomonadaceae bacterium]
MEESAPKIDERSAQDISRQLVKLLAAYAPQSNWEKQLAAPGLGAALVGIFSRFSEVVIHRLNKTPEKNLLAYLDLLGLSALPPRPARVPLTFYLTTGSLTDALVPVGTQVAAKPADGDAGPVVFETERELTVVAARLDAAFTRNPRNDSYDDKGAKLDAPDSEGTFVFVTGSFIEHSLYFSHERLLSHPALKKLTVAFELKQAFNAAAGTPSLVWEFWDGERWQAIPPAPSDARVTPGASGFVADGTASFTKGGVNQVVLTGLPVVRTRVVGVHAGRWLRARLTTQLPPAAFRPEANPRAQLPQLGKVTLTALLERSLDGALGLERLPVEAAFLNYTPVDASKTFPPFGEKPRVGDALYLAQSEAFSAKGAKVSIQFNVTRPVVNPVTEKEYPPPVVRHAWEFWDGRGWTQLFTSELTADGKPLVKESVAGTAPTDETQALTKSGRVSFTLPAAPARTAVNGVENFWVRVRIVSGDYGKEAYYKLKKPAQTNPPTPDEYALVPASFAPPTVEALAVGYAVTETEPPDAIVTYNNFNFETVPRGATFEPFQTIEETAVTFYVGFTLPGAPRPFPNRVVSLYVGVSDPLPDEEVVASPSAPPRLEWEYWDGRAWSKLTVFDGTADLTRTGMLEFLAPPDFTPRGEFGLERFWVRVAWTSGQYQFEPRLRSLRLNTVMAAQTLTVRDESLGSSDASAGQKFTTTAAPVLAGQRLQVREPDRPSAEERARIEDEEGPDAVTVTLDETERPVEIWVRWHEVPDFYGSGPRDRHYVVNHLTGEVSFGDGLNGLIPPRGAGNLRLKSYQSGGGSAGNRPAETIIELKTTIPYIDRVSNAEPATGGADAESRDSLVRRGPRTIRHRDRAVTVQDYEDLAMLASSEVARVKCFPLQDLAARSEQNKLKTGVVSLVVVPNSADAKPYPSLELLDAVRSHLEPRRAVEVVRLVIVPPKYVRVTVLAEVVPESAAAVGNLDANVAGALARFLHPLTGGAEGAGWSFGRRPHDSDIYAVIESVAGVGYVRRLKLDAALEVSGKEKPIDIKTLPDWTDYFLVYSGVHVIKLVFD